VTIIYFSVRGQGRIIFKAKADAMTGLLSVLKKRKKIQTHKKVKNAYIWRILNKKLIKLRS